MIWAVWALGNAGLYGIVAQLNSYWRLPGKLLVRWRNLIPAAFAFPFVILFPPPGDPLFYVAAITSSLLTSFHDARMFDLAGKFGGAVVLRLRSLVLPLVFLGWLVIDPGYLTKLFTHPWLGSGLLLCLLVSSFCLFQLQHCAISRAAMKSMLPIILAGVGFDIANKTAMDHGAFPQNIAYYIFLVSGLPILYRLILNPKRTPKFVREMASVSKRGAIVGLIWVGMMLTKNMAMMITPNPAYVTAVTLTSPFWASLLMQFRGEKEEADWLSGTGLVVSIIALTILSTFIH
jgi:hypothetical protein